MEKNVRKVKLGGVTVRLRNYADVDEGLLARVFAKSGLSSHQLLLILDTKDDFGCKDNGARGKTIPSKLLNPNERLKLGYDQDKGVTHFREIDAYKWPDKTEDIWDIDQWDVVVYLPRKSTSCWFESKPYVVWVLAHELEHARIIREDVEFHFCMTWLYDYCESIFSRTSAPCKWQKRWCFPLELHCHKRGKDTAVSLFGKHTFEECIKRRGEKESEASGELDFLLQLRADPHENHVVEHINKQILSGYTEDARRAAHDVWGQHRCEGCESVQLFNLGKYMPLGSM